jgi:hypothetical protein
MMRKRKQVGQERSLSPWSPCVISCLNGPSNGPEQKGQRKCSKKVKILIGIPFQQTQFSQVSLVSRASSWRDWERAASVKVALVYSGGRRKERSCYIIQATHGQL